MCFTAVCLHIVLRHALREAVSILPHVFNAYIPLFQGWEALHPNSCTFLFLNALLQNIFQFFSER